MVNIILPGQIEAGAARMHEADPFITWMYLLYHFGKLSFVTGGKSEDYNQQILSLARKAGGATGFVYVRFEENPAKYALITYSGHYASDTDVTVAKEELKKLVKIVDLEFETNDAWDLTLKYMKSKAINRRNLSKRLLIDYLEQLKKNYQGEKLGW